jgi:cell division protein FtsB
MTLLPSIPRKYKGRLALCAVALILFVVAAVFGDHGLVHLRELQQARRQLEDVAFQLQQRNEQLRQRVRRLQSDDLFLEKLAREQLGMVKPGEIVYRLTPPRPAEPAAR